MTPDAKLLSIEIGRIAAALQTTNKLRADQLLQISREVAQLTAPGYVDGSGWYPMVEDTPRDLPLLGVVDGKVRVIQWGKTSHVPMYGWCLADQGVEDFDLCRPTHWRRIPPAPSCEPST